MKKKSTSAFAYFFRNFWGIAVFTIIPSLLLGFSTTDGERGGFIALQLQTKAPNSGFMQDLVDNFLSFRVDVTLPIMIAGIFLTVLAFSFLLPKINRHMRLGVYSNSGLGKLARVNFLRVLLVVGMLIVFNLLLTLLLVGIMYFVTQYVDNALSTVIFLILLCVIRFIVGVLFAYLTCVLPIADEENYKINIAISYSVRLMSRDKKFVLTVAALYLLMRISVVSLCYVLPLGYLKSIVASLYYFVILSIVIPLICSKYVVASQGERNDISKSFFREQNV